MKKNLLLLFLWFNIQFLFAQKIIGYDKTEVVNLLKSALDYEYSDWEKSQSLIEKAEQIADKSTSAETKAWFKADVAIIYYDRDLLDISLKYTLDAYQFFKTQNKSKALECESLLAIIYARMNNHNEALKYFRNYYKSINNTDSYQAIKTLNNIGNVYLTVGKQDSASYYFNKAIALLKPDSDKKLVVMLNSNLARTLSSTKPTDAEAYFLKAVTLASEIDDSNTKCVLYNYLSEFYLSVNKPELAVSYAEKALRYSNVKFSFQNQRVLKSLYKSYLAAGKYKEATEFFQKYDQIRDSLNIEEKAVNIEREKIQYAFKDKEKETQLVNNQKRLRLVYAILALLFVLATLIIFLIRYKNTIVKEKLGNDLSQARENELKLALELRNKELFTKVILENEKATIYQQLNEDLISIRNIENVEQLKKEINSIIFRLSKNPNKIYWEEFELRFNNIYDSFYERLLIKHPNLSPNDKKMCALIKLNLSSKDIASITQTSVKSVENSRTRLRKKLDLTHSNIELHRYLSGV